MSDKPARYWRADGGYQDAPPPQAMAPYYCMPNFAPWWCQPWQQQGYANTPYPVAGLCTPPPAYGQQSPPPPPLPPAPTQEYKKKEEEKEKKGNSYAPPKMPNGANYMFDRHHTMVHVFNKAAAVWEEKYRKEKLYVFCVLIEIFRTLLML